MEMKETADPIFFINNFAEPIRSRYFKRFQYRDFANVVKTTHEGVEAVDMLIDYLSTQDKLFPLNWDQDLADLAQTNLSSIEVETETTIKNSGLSSIKLIDFGINPNAKLYEYIECGSPVGFEAFSKIMICDGIYDRTNMKSIMNNNHAFVGVAHSQTNDQFGCITYLIIGDKSIHDTTDLTLSNKKQTSNKLDDSISSFERIIQKAEENEEQEQQNDSQAPMLNIYI